MRKLPAGIGARAHGEVGRKVLVLFWCVCVYMRVSMGEGEFWLERWFRVLLGKEGCASWERAQRHMGWSGECLGTVQMSCMCTGGSMGEGVILAGKWVEEYCLGSWRFEGLASLVLQLGLGTRAHGEVGRVFWHCSGRLQVYGSSYGEAGAFGGKVGCELLCG
nr:hypothetical protein [Tanacetum cinerariifolium]